MCGCVRGTPAGQITKMFLCTKCTLDRFKCGEYAVKNTVINMVDVQWMNFTFIYLTHHTAKMIIFWNTCSILLYFNAASEQSKLKVKHQGVPVAEAVSWAFPDQCFLLQNWWSRFPVTVRQDSSNQLLVTSSERWQMIGFEECWAANGCTFLHFPQICVWTDVSTEFSEGKTHV